MQKMEEYKMRVVYYARVSTEEEKQLNALKNQIEMLEEYINNQDTWKLVDKYVDEGVTGTEAKKRFHYNRMLEDLEENKFDTIVIKDESRLMRSTLDWHLFIDKLVKNEKKLFFYNEKKFFEPQDKLITSIKAAVAEEYSRDLSSKVKLGQRKKQEKGVVFGNGRIWGYDQKEGKLTINEKEADVIRQIFDMYVNNYGFRTIFKALEELGYRNRNGKLFSITTLKRIIRNEKYKGVLVSNRRNKDFNTKKVINVSKDQWIVHEGIVPAIVSEEIWNKANEILSTKKKKNPTADKKTISGYFSGNHLYSSKIICGECGSTFWHTIYRKKSLWMCKEYKTFGLKKEGKPHGCIGTKIHSEVLDAILQDIITEFWQNREDNIRKVLAILDKVLQNNGYNEGIEKLEKDKTKNNQKLDNLIDMRADGEITKEKFMAKQAEIEDILNKIEIRIREYTLKNESTINKKQRMLEIQSLLNEKLVKSNEFNDDIIAHFLNKIVVKSQNELLIYLNGDFQYIVNFNNDCFQYVSSTG